MDAAIRNGLEARAIALKAVGPATRLFVVQEPGGGEHYVCELQESAP